MIMYKIITGFVTQVYDTKTHKFIKQSFEGNNNVYTTEYQDKNGNWIVEDDNTVSDDPQGYFVDKDGKEPYLALDMVQPNVISKPSINNLMYPLCIFFIGLFLAHISGRLLTYDYVIGIVFYLFSICFVFCGFNNIYKKLIKR